MTYSKKFLFTPLFDFIYFILPLLMSHYVTVLYTHNILQLPLDAYFCFPILFIWDIHREQAFGIWKEKYNREEEIDHIISNHCSIA